MEGLHARGGWFELCVFTAVPGWVCVNDLTGLAHDGFSTRVFEVRRLFASLTGKK